MTGTLRNRWKGFSEFMFWGSFSWDYKGPCYIWEKETGKEKKESAAAIEQLSAELEPIMRE